MNKKNQGTLILLAFFGVLILVFALFMVNQMSVDKGSDGNNPLPKGLQNDPFKPDDSQACEDQEIELASILAKSINVLESRDENDYEDTMSKVEEALNYLDINFNKYHSEFYYVVEAAVDGRHQLEMVGIDDYQDSLYRISEANTSLRHAHENLINVCNSE